MRRTKFLENLLQNLGPDVEESTKWLLSALANKSDKIYEEVAREKGFITTRTARKIAIEKTSRKRKADGPPLAIARSSGRKVDRDDTRSVNHAAEQMRPAGEKIQPNEVSKLDYKNNST
jgi:hypothetical protein